MKLDGGVHVVFVRQIVTPVNALKERAGVHLLDSLVKLQIFRFLRL